MTELCTIVDGILPHPPFQGISYITNKERQKQNKTKKSCAQVAFSFQLKEITGGNVQDVPKLRHIWVTHPFSNFIVLNQRICLKQILGAFGGRVVKQFRAKCSDSSYIIVRPNFFPKEAESKYFKPWGTFDLYSCSGEAALGNTQTSRCNCAPIKLEFENRRQVRFCPEAVVC